MEGRRKRKGEKRATFAPPLDGAGPPDAFHPGFRHPWRGSVTRGYGSTAPSGPPSRSGVLPTGKQNPYWALMPNRVGPTPPVSIVSRSHPPRGGSLPRRLPWGKGPDRDGRPRREEQAAFGSGRESPEGEKQAAFGSGREAPKGRNRPPSDRDGSPRRGI
jgi:hypothetical protein